MTEEVGYRVALKIFGHFGIENLNKWLVSVDRGGDNPYSSDLTREEINDNSRAIPLVKLMEGQIELDSFDHVFLCLDEGFRYRKFTKLKAKEVIPAVQELENDPYFYKRNVRKKVIEPLKKNFQKVFSDYTPE